MPSVSELHRMEAPVEYCTGAYYIGKLDSEHKMSGFGRYRYPNGIEYVGYFRAGVFHGSGMLIHPSQFKLCGIFLDGKCVSSQTYFGDGLEFTLNDWKYCTLEDRRYWSEIVRGMPPVGESYLTKEKPPRIIPKGMYDAEEGFFDPNTRYMYDAESGTRIRYICAPEKNKILSECRRRSSDFLLAKREEYESRPRDIETDSWVSEDDVVTIFQSAIKLDNLNFPTIDNIELDTRSISWGLDDDDEDDVDDEVI